MGPNTVIAKLIFIPSKFYQLGNVSMYDLLKETDYFVMYEQISETDIYKALDEHPECIDEWIRYSQDKRVSSGWYLKKDNDAYILGFFAEKDKNTAQQKFIDRKEACAAFIKREAEYIRQSG